MKRGLFIILFVVVLLFVSGQQSCEPTISIGGGPPSCCEALKLDGTTLSCVSRVSQEDCSTKYIGEDGYNFYDQECNNIKRCVGKLSCAFNGILYENQAVEYYESKVYQCINGKFKLVVNFSCFDSDGGANYFVKGAMIGIYTDNKGTRFDSWIDYCGSGGWEGYLTEYSCSPNNGQSGGASEGVSGWSDFYKCPNGCKDGACIKYSDPNYNCNFCDGFCYISDDSKNNMCYNGRFFEWPKELEIYDYEGKSCQTDNNCFPSLNCINQKCLLYPWNNPYKLPLQIIPIYPKSIPRDSDFNLKLFFKNRDSEPIEITIKNIQFSLFKGVGGEQVNLDYENTTTINPNSEIEFNIPMHAFNRDSMTASISIGIVTDRNIWFTLFIDPLIIYIDYTPLENICGSKTYTTKSGVCINGILYPTYAGGSCTKDADCVNNNFCLHYSCISNTLDLGFKPDREHNVGILPIFIYNDANLLLNNTNFEITKLKSVINQANEWFVNEKTYWNSNSNFIVKYNLLDNICIISKDENLAIMKEVNSGYDYLKELSNKCNITTTNYDIIAVHQFWQENLVGDEEFKEMSRIGLPGAAGINYGDKLLFGFEEGDGTLNFGVLIHETLHSFGELDLYLQNGFQNNFFQERDCNLFMAKWKDFRKYPHLCSFEAKIIGLKK